MRFTSGLLSHTVATAPSCSTSTVSYVAIIGMADNVLRPILVGRDTGIPDWLVLVTTLGGIASMGLSGIVVGPLVCGLFLAAWGIFAEQREGGNSPAATNQPDQAARIS